MLFSHYFQCLIQMWKSKMAATSGVIYMVVVVIQLDTTVEPQCNEPGYNKVSIITKYTTLVPAKFSNLYGT